MEKWSIREKLVYYTWEVGILHKTASNCVNQCVFSELYI